MSFPVTNRRFPFETVVRLAAIFGVSFWIAFLLRFDFTIPPSELPGFYRSLAIVVLSKTTVWLLIGLHLERWWRHQGFQDLVPLLKTNIIAATVSGLFIYTLIGASFPRSVYCLDFLVCLLSGAAMRFGVRLYIEWQSEQARQDGEKGLLIYGAGVAGINLAREIRHNPKLGYRVLGFVDDDPRKRGAKITGLPVLGRGEDLAAVVARHESREPRIQELVVAMPSVSGRQIRQAVQKGESVGIPSRVVPGLGELINGKLALGRGREVSVTDLLGRETVELDLEIVQEVTTGRCILVTGAAGSIGSEICSQLAQLQPRAVIAFDQAESELFRLENDLLRKYPGMPLIVEVGDIRDPNQVADVIDRYAVNSIYHAAAYKHVPLMERQIFEAVRNNVLGTWNLAQAAWRAKVSRFLLISTDKAVNPTSVMGLTKRVSELIVSAYRSSVTDQPTTKFMSVRFGNVLVSNGSVVPTFQKQIAAGGPVTVTHQDMRRYFMTTQEAAQLVLQASALSEGGEIFVLDMGKPVKIVDLARRMISLTGFVPDEDIEIRFTGLRPGEKMFEEISLDTENTVPTSHSKIHIFQAKRLTLQQLAPWIAELQYLLRTRDATGVIAHLRILVPEYRPSETQISIAPPVNDTPTSPENAITSSTLVPSLKALVG